MATAMLQAQTHISSETIARPARGLDGLHALMDRYVDGDQMAFAQLHERLVPRVKARLSKMIRDASTVDDLAQLTFMRAHQARGRFASSDGGNPDRAVEGWYLAIARNVALDHLRHTYRRDQRHAKLEARGEIEGMGAPDAPLNPEDVRMQREGVEATRRRVRDAIEQLPPGQREVVQLHKLRGLSMGEIAERLEVRPGALRVRAHRAYKTLANLLAGPRPSSAAT